MKAIVILIASLICMLSICKAQVVHSSVLMPNIQKGTVIDSSSRETTPNFRGGDSIISSYISTHLHYPKREKRLHIEGTVKVLFKIGNDGKLTDVIILNSDNYNFSDEARRIIKKLPRFVPGKQGGIPGDKIYVINVDFKLDKNKN